MFKVDASNLPELRIELTGFLSMAETEAFAAAIEDGFAKARAAHGRVRLMVLANASPIQLPNVVARLTKLMREITRDNDRIAVIMSSALFKMQVRRFIEGEELRMFDDESAARTWLFSKD